tara:strand:+ start:49953 stop:50348 length:396 start_codon:yes stop_codon:yes gene_type:complete
MERGQGLMLSGRVHPAEAYRQVEFDARVHGASQQELVWICFEQLTGALGTAIHVHEIGDPQLRSRSLSRAVSSLLALEMGLSGDDPVVLAMRDLYSRARSSILSCAVDFDAERLDHIRRDFIDIHAALSGG